MSNSKRVSAWGRSGMGKSTLMDQMMLSLDHLILFDYPPTRRPYAVKHGFQEVTSIADLRTHIAASYGAGVRVWFRPPINDQVQALHEVSDLLFKIQAARVEAGKQVPRFHLAVDELAQALPVERLPVHQRGFDRLASAGRHYEIGLIGGSQQPSKVGTTFRGNCDVRYFFNLVETPDLLAVEKMVGKHIAIEVSKLPPYHYIRVAPEGVSVGMTRL